MTVAKSKLAAQGQVSIRRERRYTSEEVQRALFPEEGPAGRAPDVKEGTRKYIRKKHASR